MLLRVLRDDEQKSHHKLALRYLRDSLWPRRPPHPHICQIDVAERKAIVDQLTPLVYSENILVAQYAAIIITRACDHRYGNLSPGRNLAVPLLLDAYQKSEPGKYRDLLKGQLRLLVNDVSELLKSIEAE